MNDKFKITKEVPPEVEVLYEGFDLEETDDLDFKVLHSGSCEDLTMLGLYSPDNEDFN